METWGEMWAEADKFYRSLYWWERPLYKTTKQLKSECLSNRMEFTIKQDRYLQKACNVEALISCLNAHEENKREE